MKKFISNTTQQEKRFNHSGVYKKFFKCPFTKHTRRDRARGEAEEMTYNIEWLSSDFAKGKKLKFVFFWGHQKSKNHEITSTCFSQWYAAPFTVDGVRYGTAEH